MSIPRSTTRTTVGAVTAGVLAAILVTPAAATPTVRADLSADVVPMMHLVPSDPDDAEPPSGSDETSGGDESSGSNESSGDSTGDTAAKGAVSASGSATGAITDVAVTCTSSGGYLSWELKGSLNGSKVTLNYTTNNYRGAGSYNTTTITDNQGGQLTWYVDDVGKAVSNGADNGEFVVGADERSGSVDTRIAGDDQYTVRFSGPWECSQP